MSSGESDILFLIITHMEEDGITFWAQRHTPTISLDLEHVTSRLERISLLASSVSNPIEGGIYGAKFVDDSWYRCRVLFPISKTKCLVQYIDFGNCEEKSKSALVNIPIDLQESSMPAMAHRYRLNNLHIEPENVASARKHIEMKCSDEFVKARLVSAPKISPPLEVILFDEEGNSISEQLICLGLAVDSASSKMKKSVRMSSPVVSRAQQFRNPLLSSDEGNESDDLNNNARKSSFQGFDSTGGPDGLVQGKIRVITECENCESNKEMAERMRLSMIKLRHDLTESEIKITTLVDRGEFWKKKYLKLKEEQIRGESNPEAITTKLKSQRQEPEEDIPSLETKSKRPAIQNVIEMKSPPRSSSMVNSSIGSPWDDSDLKKQMDESYVKLSSIMKRVVLPIFEFTKKLSSSNRVVDDFLKHGQELKEIVSKIRNYLDAGGNLNSDQFLALISRRNAILQDLKQTIRSALPLVTTADDSALKEKVDTLLAQLKKLLAGSDSSSDNTGKDITIIEVCEAIQKWKTDKDSDDGISGIVCRLHACLSQQSKKYYDTYELSEQVKEMQEAIASFQSQEKTMKEALDETKNIRRKRQKIRLLVAEMKNLEEEEKDSDDSERELLKIQKGKIAGDLSSQREDLQDCFEKKWILMESLTNMVEKFSPELQNEHPELGIEDYIIGKAIVMKDMEFDHFTIKNVQIDKNLNLEVFRTQYRKEPIALHKYPCHAVSNETWDQVLQYIAIYTNIDSPNAEVPLGIFRDKDALYVMVSLPQAETFSIDEVLKCDEAFLPKILECVASAIAALHENGIAHGHISKNAVSVAVKPCIQAYLSVPNFFDEPINALHAEDIRHYGLMAKSLIANHPDPNLEAVVENCLQNYTTITMETIVDAF